jgi:thioredoxin 2
MMAPTFEQVSKDFALKTLFAKVDTQDQQLTASKFAIRSIPTLIIFKNGMEVNRISGALDQASLKQFVNSAI